MEECPGEVSPCKCRTPVHLKCLQDFRITSLNSDNEKAVGYCTICNHGYVEIPYETPDEYPLPEFIETATSKEYKRGVRIFLIVVVILFGYFLRCLQYMINRGKVSQDFWYPYSEQFVIYWVITFLICRCCCPPFDYKVALRRSEFSSESEELIAVP